MVGVLLKSIPCLTETKRAFMTETKTACARESSRENSSSLVTEVERVRKTACKTIKPK